MTLSPGLPVPHATLYLCRHGETALNRENVLQGSGVDAPLNAVGWAQARQLGERFRDVHLDWLVSSELRRACETAQAIHEHHPGLKYTKYAALAELCWGIWEGKKCPCLQELFSKWNQGDYQAALEGGESPAHAVERVAPALGDILAKATDQAQIAVVIHGRLLRIILAYLIEGSLDYMGSYQHRNTCVNVIQVYKRSALTEDEIDRLWHDRVYPTGATWAPRPHAPTADHLAGPLHDYLFIPSALDCLAHLESGPNSTEVTVNVT
ncbi:hypothetical protein IWQ60_003306 [Tieghemiomyces parasiticus]|uniref:Uncharacterized protein n=1 Tax=Tieghemiomyces parasiticus TaxID=78921 RepID=A0A9W8AHP4_9FUNG|nr:hypothetical protein IWQ60_003306 [Tieghemiomyces parasiticus]